MQGALVSDSPAKFHWLRSNQSPQKRTRNVMDVGVSARIFDHQVNILRGLENVTTRSD